ncbi:S-layer homology domain-containing protein [Lysinibacillus sp. 1P01SD]|uniref:GA-like domain-containing protein n=1 Tax=Lysinibacillus sp. 1P01SD TaxID=3132285 RepID=UPI0039A3458F
MKNNKKDASRQSARKSKMLGKVNKSMIAGAIALSSIAPTMVLNIETANAAFSGGLGTVNDPYIITSASQLVELGNYVTGYFKLGNDIDFGYMPVTQIGTDSLPFKGVLDGNGHTLKNFNIDNATAEATGLFNYTEGATFKDLKIESANVTNTKGEVGILVGNSYNTSFIDIEISNSSATVNPTSSVDTAVGLLVGKFQGNNKLPSEIKNIKVQGTVTGKSRIGGVIGHHYVASSHVNIIDGIDVDVIANGTGSTSYPAKVGGVIGVATASNSPSTSSFTFNNVKVRGELTSTAKIGGLIGHTNAKVEMNNAIIKASLKGLEGATSTLYLGGAVGDDGNGARRGIFVNSPVLEIAKDTKYASVIVGSKISSNLSYINPKYMETMTLKGGVRRDNESGATFSTYSQAQSLQKATYAQAGFDFKDTWGIYEGRSEPFLLFAMTDAEREEWEKENPPVDIYAEARQAVEKAERTHLQSDVDTAQSLINPLPTGTEKTELQNRLNAVQDAINKAKALEQATKAVEKAEATRTRTDFNTAQTLVTALPSSSEKTALQNRLNALLSIIEGIEADEQALANATRAVEKAEATRSQNDIDYAQGLVTALKPSTAKTALQDRLDALRKSIEEEKENDEALAKATKAVEKAEATRLISDIDYAQDLVTALKPSTAKNALQARLDALRKSVGEDNDALSKATKAVEKAETTRLDSDIDYAQGLVTALKPSAEKNALQARLDALRQSIDEEKENNEALAKATKAVEKAESTRLDEDIEYAQGLVTALKPSTAKDALQARLDALRQSIKEENDEALAKATKAVEKAEATRLDSDINYAQGLVTALRPSAEKNALQARLDALRKSIEQENDEALAKATKAVEKAEATRLDADINYAQGLVTALKPSTAKDALQARLDALRKSIEQENDEALAKATKAVEKAESTRLTSDIDYAQGLVTALKPSTAKDALQARLDALRKSVEEEKENDEALAKATKAVEKAESSRLISDIDYAQGLVTALKPSTAKNALQARLDALRNSIEEENTNNEALAEATRAVIKAESTRLDADIDYAQKLVTALKPSTAKDALQARLDALRQSIQEEKEYNEALAKATRAVEKAESTRLISDIDYAQGLVTALKPSTEKKALQERLDALRKSVEEEQQNDEALTKATKAVEKAESTRLMTDVDYAQGLVTALKASKAKDALQARLDALRKSIEAEGTDNEALAKATQAVVKAESTRLQTDIDTAQGLVTALKPSKEKDALQDRLDALRKSIEQEKADKEALEKAEDAVEKAEDTLKQEDKDTAQDLVDKLPNGKDKDRLQDRLDAVQDAIDKAKSNQEALKKATKAVEKAEATLSQTDIDTAQRLVTALKSSKEKEALQARLDALQHLVNKQNSESLALAKATQAVVKAESTRQQADIDTARELVFKLPNSTEKDALYDRLDALQKSIDKEKADKEALAKATKAVEVAESTKMQKDVNTAQNLVADLSGSEEKFKLQQRIDAISPVIHIDENGTVTATFKSPKTQQLKVETDDLKIELENEYQNASMVKVVWKTVAGNKRQLQVIVDGKEAESFKKPAKVSVKLPQAYLVREVADGSLRAVLYKYEQGRYVFETNVSNDVYMFTTKQRNFKDTDGVYSQAEINELASRYVIYGTTPTTYTPNKDITRGQFSALIARSLGLRTDKATTFSDMQGHWFAGEVQALKDIGIIQGKGADKFDPNDTLTHQQTALMISRLLEYLGSDVPLNNPTFHDNSEISDEAWKAVGQLQSAGILTGTTKNNKFEPNANLTRAEMAKVLYNTLDVAGYMKDSKANKK